MKKTKAGDKGTYQSIPFNDLIKHMDEYLNIRERVNVNEFDDQKIRIRYVLINISERTRKIGNLLTISCISFIGFVMYNNLDRQNSNIIREIFSEITIIVKFYDEKKEDFISNDL